jgi:REP element-mobilizing transposase RayT
MPGPLRPIDDRLVYDVINRGNHRAPVFFDDADFEAFLEAIGDLKKRRPFAFHRYCLMSDHLYLLIRTRDIPISRIMQSLLVSHTLRFHRLHQT